MRYGKWFLVLILFSLVAAESCIFQNDPTKPNVPPVITAFSPEEIFLTRQAPAEKIVFSLEATDPDRDEVTYIFVLSDTIPSTPDSILTGGVDSAEFEALNGGFYHVQGRAYDGSGYACRDWYITVIEETNEPPEITFRYPDMDSISTVVGSTMEFRINVWDDHPEYLRYTYLVDGKVEKYYSTNPVFNHRFPENGIYEVVGTVWDWEFGDTTTWYVNVIGEPDTVPPCAITDLEGWTGTTPGSISLQWTAPGDDWDEGRANLYRVKTATVPILTENDWTEASLKYGAPDPSTSGTTEEMIAINCYPGTYLYVTVRALDDFGNIGPIGNCICLLVRGYDATGVVFDASTGDPVAGAVVSADMLSDTTAADGVYNLYNLPKYAQIIRVRDETGPERGAYLDMSYEMEKEPAGHFTLDLLLVPDYPIESGRDDRYEDLWALLEELTGTTGWLGRNTIYRNWDHWPVTVYNPPMVYMDVDLQEEARGSMASWENLTGLDLFEEIEDSLAADCRIVYFPESDDKHRTRTIVETEDEIPVKKEIWISLLNHASPMWIQAHMIYCHEFGHVIGLLHSYDTGHLMLGMSTPRINDPSLDEVRIMRIIYRMPNFFDSDWVLYD